MDAQRREMTVNEYRATTQNIFPRFAGEGDHAQHGGGGVRRPSSPGIKVLFAILRPDKIIDRARSGRLLMKPLSLAMHGFMAFWYSYVGTLNSIWPSITLQGKRLVIFPNVYKPIENEQVSSEYCREGDRVLDLGCGSGVGTVFCAPKAREVIAVDISLAAVRNTEENCRIHGLKNVKVIQSDMFSRVEGKYDLILANSPYIEDEFEVEEKQFATSVKYMPTLFAQVGDYLAEDGRLLLQFPLGSRQRIEKLASEHGLELISMRRLPPKPLVLSLLSVLYMQVGFKSTLYLLQRQSAPPLAPTAEPAGEASRLPQRSAATTPVVEA
jgi:SAM-dependent methyltransferase